MGPHGPIDQGIDLTHSCVAEKVFSLDPRAIEKEEKANSRAVKC